MIPDWDGLGKKAEFLERVGPLLEVGSLGFLCSQKIKILVRIRVRFKKKYD